VIEDEHAVADCLLEDFTAAGWQGLNGCCDGIDEGSKHACGCRFAAAGRALEDEDWIGARRLEGGSQEAKKAGSQEAEKSRSQEFLGCIVVVREFGRRQGELASAGSEGDLEGAGDLPSGGSDLDSVACGVGEVDEDGGGRVIGLGASDDADVDGQESWFGVRLGAEDSDGLVDGVFCGRLIVELDVLVGEPVADVGRTEWEGLAGGEGDEDLAGGGDERGAFGKCCEELFNLDLVSRFTGGVVAHLASILVKVEMSSSCEFL
jgi:hypothetical protein